MQLISVTARVRSILTFSILGRIERDATPAGRVYQLAPASFQYPRSDRAGCNKLCITAYNDTDKLSVSSVGSSGMQRGYRGHHRGSRGAFSILGRIERDATARGP